MINYPFIYEHKHDKTHHSTNTDQQIRMWEKCEKIHQQVEIIVDKLESTIDVWNGVCSTDNPLIPTRPGGFIETVDLEANQDSHSTLKNISNSPS